MLSKIFTTKVSTYEDTIYLKKKKQNKNADIKILSAEKLNDKKERK